MRRRLARLLGTFLVVAATAAPAAPPARGPGGGPLVPIGEVAFLEVGFLSGPGILRLSVLRPDLQRGVRLGQEKLALKIRELRGPDGALLREGSFRLDLAPVSNPETYESPGNTSEFAAQSDLLAGAASFEALLREIRIDGDPVRVVRLRYPGPAAR